MARELAKRKKSFESLPFKKANYQIIGVGLISIVFGYVALAQQPWDGVLPLVVAPILLVLGYCILVPLGILYRDKNGEKKDTSPTSTTAPLK